MDMLGQGYNLTTHIQNLQLSYDDLGQGDVPIIFLHGFPFDKTMWHAQLEFLKSAHRVIAYDIRGFGKSTDETSPLSIDLFSEDLIACMDKLNIEKAILCGLSMGGYIALHAMEKFAHRFEALILCDTQCIADTPEVKEKRYKTIDAIHAQGVADFNEGFIKSVFHKDSLSNKNDVVEKLRAVVFANPQQIITKGLTALAERAETCTNLANISIPAMIICGREDGVTPLVRSEFMHTSIKGSILHIIDQAGHVSNLEQPLVFNKHLLDFTMHLQEKRTEKVEGIHGMD